MMKKNTFKILLLMIVAFATLQSFAQRKVANNIPSKVGLTEANKAFVEEYGVIKCATVEYNDMLRQQYPERTTNDEFEAWISGKIQEMKANRVASPDGTTIVYTIPVVVHVFHNGESVGTAPNIVDAQVESQITIMNEDYRRMASTPGGANSTGAAVDVEIEFCLAQIDPDGNSTNGIDRVNIGQDGINEATLSAAQAAMNALKPGSQWDPTKYLNMWTVKFSGGAAGLLGYAQFPDDSGLSGINASGGAADTDGVVAGYQYFGSTVHDNGHFILSAPYDRGRTMTHEVGHWLGLRHIWGDGDCAADDYCNDTPRANDSHGSCGVYNTCDDTAYGAASDPNDMVQNYMDYTNDTCMDTFTQDQKDRMVIVMQNSPRRVELATSNVCDPAAPYIKFNNGPGTINESTNCNYQDYDISLGIATGPSADATVTFTVDSGTATQNIDYEILTGSVIFLQGETSDKTMTVRVYNDGFVEGDETVTFGMSISTTGDAVPITTSENQFILTIVDDNNAPATSSSTQIFYDDYSDGDASDWTVIDNNSQTDDDWSLAQESDWETPFGLYTDYFMKSYSWNGQAYSPDNFLSSPAISIPAGGTVELKYFMGAANDNQNYQENYQVWISAAIASVADITSGTLLVDSVLPDELAHYYTHDISAFAGQTVYVSFRHHDTTDKWILAVDEIEVTAELSTAVQVDNNTATPTDFTVKGSGSAYFYDTTTSNIMMGINNTGGLDYACVSAFISRDLNDAGAAAVIHQNPSTASFVMAKSFTVNPGTVNASGTVEVTFYFTETEVAAWETATGSSRNDLAVIKNNESAPATLGAFGSDVTLTATFDTGINGVYVFGKEDATVGIKDFTFETFMVYPNPSEGIFNLSLQSSNDKNLAVQLFDMRGRLINEKDLNLSHTTVNTTLDFSSIEVGVYLLKVVKGNQIGVQQIIIK
jgi:hypothetical protein